MAGDNSDKAVLITGCSSGIGECVAAGLKARGYRVFASARKDADVARLEEEGFEAIKLDLRDAESIKAALDTLLTRTGGKLYALFNNGAYGQPVRLKTWIPIRFEPNSRRIFSVGTN